MKKQNVMEEDWDTLIVLDACRYDYFEKVYKEYLDGKLEKRDSGAGATVEWLAKTFPENYPEVSYLSANPYINSKDLNLQDVSQDHYDWKATDHFGYVGDLWISAWDDEFNTAMPDLVKEEALKHPHLQRTIIHFIQPHLPYIHPESNYEAEWTNKKIMEGEIKLIDRIRDFILYDIWKRRIIENIRGDEYQKDSKPDAYYEFSRLGQLDRIPEFYEYTLREALKAVTELTSEIDGKIIITADHGECFGEYDTWLHQNVNHNPILTTVPWLEVNENE